MAERQRFLRMEKFVSSVKQSQSDIFTNSTSCMLESLFALELIVFGIDLLEITPKFCGDVQSIFVTDISWLCVTSAN